MQPFKLVVKELDRDTQVILSFGQQRQKHKYMKVLQTLNNYWNIKNCFFLIQFSYYQLFYQMGCGAVQNPQVSSPGTKNIELKNVIEKQQKVTTNKNAQNILQQKKQAINRGYIIKELLGKGTYGQVYRCQKYQTDEQFALKIVKLNAKNKQQARRFVNNLKSEISVLKKLSHPNIVKYHTFDVSPDNETVEIVFQLIPDGSLKDYIEKNGPLTQDEARGICKQILEGLDYLHRKSIIHRDLKCANILMGKDGVVKITDFGTAKEVKVESHQDIAKLCASLKGTPYYMAPEILKRSGHNKSADIWSFGCTLIQMLTGKPPWTTLTSNFEQIISYIVSGVKPPFPPHISKQCDFFLQSCLYSVPSQRLTARQLLNHRFILNTKRNSPGLQHEQMTAEKEIKLIASLGAKKKLQSVQIMNFDDVQTTKNKKSTRSPFSEEDSQFKSISAALKQANKNRVDKPIRSSLLDTSTHNKLSQPFLKLNGQHSQQIQVSQPYIVSKKHVIKGLKKDIGSKNELKKVAKTAGHMKMTEQNLMDWNEIDGDLNSNYRDDQLHDVSIKQDSRVIETAGGKQYSSRFSTENAIGYEHAINTNLANQQRKWYMENQRRQWERKQEEKKKWQDELKRASYEVASSRRYF